MAMKYNLAATVSFITLIEGYAVYMATASHLINQPTVAAVVSALVAVLSGFVVWYIVKKNTAHK